MIATVMGVMLELAEVCLCRSRSGRVFFSIPLLSYFKLSAVVDSSGVLLSYSLISLA